MAYKEDVLKSISEGERKQKIRPSKKIDIQWRLSGQDACMQAAKHQEMLACGVDSKLNMGLSAAKGVRKGRNWVMDVEEKEPWQVTDHREQFSNRMGCFAGEGNYFA